MSDQADHLRQLVRDTVAATPCLSPGLPLVVFSGGVEGVGTTSTAEAVARELALLGKRPLLVDADLQSPRLTERLLSASPRHFLADVLDGRITTKEALHQAGDDLSLLPGRTIGDTHPELNREAFTRLLTELRGLHSVADVVLVDVGSRMSPWIDQWWRAAQQVFLLTLPTEDAIKGAYAHVKLASHENSSGKLKLIVNRSDNNDSAARIAAQFASTSRRFLGALVGEASPIAERETDDTGYQHGMRLLATDIVRESLVTSTRIANDSHRSTKHRVANFLENSAHSLNHTQ